MNSLFIRLYLDEDVSVVVASIIRARGYEVVTTREADRLHATDAEQLAYATGRGMTVVTHNRADFEVLAAEYIVASRSHAGIICAVQRPAADISKRLLRILDEVTADEVRDQVRYI